MLKPEWMREKKRVYNLQFHATVAHEGKYEKDCGDVKADEAEGSVRTDGSVCAEMMRQSQQDHRYKHKIRPLRKSTQRGFPENNNNSFQSPQSSSADMKQPNNTCKHLFS